ncbi:MAG: TonB-dependent receptor, partial [Pseudomonadota bacterium]
MPIFGVWAQDGTDQNSVATTNDTEQPLELDAVEVIAPATNRGFTFDLLRPDTLITQEELDRRQAVDIFDVLQDVPDVSISGGPLTNGKTIGLRGFQNTEDVLKKVDGAIKDFEKYRFGGGPFIDTELLKQVEVKRGASAISEGSGALGGAIVMETKDADDFLARDEWIGARIKTGYDNNNDAKTTTLSIYSAPREWVDLLFDVSERRSNELTLPNGDKLENSSSPRDSLLTKVEIYPTDHLTLSLGYTEYESESLEPPDASAGPFEANTFLRRAVNDKTRTSRLIYDPDSSWIRVEASVNRVDTTVDDIGTDPLGLPRLGTTYSFDYDLETVDLSNTALFYLGAITNELKVTAQYHRNDRDTTEATNGIVTERLAQPPGTKIYDALILENETEWRDFTFLLATRYDQYEVQSKGNAEETLIAENRATRIDLNEYSHSAQLSYRVLDGPITLSYGRSETFRPPLIDEAFGVLAATCTPGILIANTPWEPTGIFDPIPPGTPGFASGLCADLYEPERAETREVTISGEFFDLLSNDDSLNFKLTRYDIQVTDVIESITLIDPVTIGQPGIENREGWSFEVGYEKPAYFISMGWSETSGELDCPSWSPGNGEDLILPADSLTLTIGFKQYNGKIEYGYRRREVSSRNILEEGFTPTGINPCKSPLPTEQQDGYTVHNFFMSWKATPELEFKAALDNATNEEYDIEN